MCKTQCEFQKEKSSNSCSVPSYICKHFKLLTFIVESAHSVEVFLTSQ